MTNATLNGKVFLALALGAALAVQADTAVYDETTGFVTCVTKGTAGPVMSASTWSDATDFPNSQTNYYIGAGFVAKTGDYDDSKKATFSPSLYVAGQINSSGTTANGMTFDDLHLLSGAVMYNNSIPTWSGKLTIETPEGTDPVTFSHDRETDTFPFKLSMNVFGDEHARIVMTGTKTCFMSRNGSWSGFYGTFNVRNSYTISDGASASTTPGTLAFGTGCTYNQNSKKATSFGNLTFGANATVNGGVLTVSGKFEVGADSLVALSNGSSFASFSLGTGSTLQFRSADSAISVASKLELGEDVTVNYVTSKASVLRDDPFFPVFYLSPVCVEAGLPALDGINFAVSGAPEWLPADFQACYRDNPDVEGGKILGLSFPKIVRSLHSNPQTEAEAKNHETLHLFLDSEEPTEYWSDGSYPHEGCVYYSSASIAVCNKCVLPELVVHDGATFYVVGECSLNELRMANGNMYVRYDSASVTGRIGIYASSIYFRTYQGRTLRLNADIYGEGNMDFRVYYPSGTSVSKFYLSGDNSGWSGGLYFSKADESGKTYVLSEQNHVKLYVNNSASLGGGTTEFAYNKIQLNDYAEILVTENVDFTNACRGVYVKANGAISVDAGRTARFAAPVTMDGTLRKNGAGTLVLGGPMRFLSGKASVEDPVGDGNLVAVTAGSLAVADCNALNGAKLSFADGTALVVSADATGDLKTNGARFDKIAAPFATEVPVRIETADPAKLTENSYSVGLVTVKTTDAESVKLSVTSGIRGFRVTSVTSAPGAVADTVTFTATLEKQGLMLILR